MANKGGKPEDVSNQYEETTDAVPLVPCKSWDFDQSIYLSTVVTQFNLVCGRRYLAASIQSTYMAGGFIGTICFGALSDRVLGRRRTMLTSLVIIITGGLAAPFASSYLLFVLLRFYISFGVSGSFQSGHIMVVEHLDIKNRATLTLVSGMYFGLGFAIMPLYAYYIRDWSTLQLAFALTSCFLLVYFWILPESPRWLASNGHIEKAIRALERIAWVNGYPKPDRAKLLEIVEECSNEKEIANYLHLTSRSQAHSVLNSLLQNFKALMSTRKNVKKTIALWILFLAVSFVYYGFAFSTTSLISDPFLVVSIGGALEIPAAVVAIPFLNRYGRRPTIFLLYFFTSTSALAIALSPTDLQVFRVALSCIGKFFIAAAFSVLYLVAAEVYPTVSRTSCQAIAILMGRVGAITAPYAADLATSVSQDFPNIIFAIVALVASTMAFLLPEMKGVDMQDHLEIIELDLKPDS